MKIALSEEKKSTQKIRVGIVGLGRAGKRIHYTALKNNSSFVVTAVADPDESRADEIKSETGCLVFHSIEDLLGSKSCDLVVIATPSQCHFDDAVAVLRSGISCFLEKPMASTYEEAKELVEI